MKKEYRELSPDELRKIQGKLPEGLWEEIPTDRELTEEEAIQLGEKYDHKYTTIPKIRTNDERASRGVKGQMIIRVVGKPKGFESPQTKLQKALEDADDMGHMLNAVVKDYFQDIEKYSGQQQQAMRIQGFEKVIDRIEKLAGIERKDTIHYIFDDPFSPNYIDPTTKNDISDAEVIPDQPDKK